MRAQYFTTPIYYVNGKPHIGHAYSTVATDTLVRYAKVRGHRTRFLTGTDEHGLKIERKAQEEGLSPKAFVDRLIPDFVDAWAAMGCEYDDFIRTTDAKHEAFVAMMWKRCLDKGDIYLGEYEGWYSAADEAYYTEKDIENGRAKETGNVVEKVKESTYYFRLSNYTEPLLRFYEENPQFVTPEGRFNEVKSFVKEGLRDLSISRPTVRWGIPVPGDPEHTIYVWFDALINYVSGLCDGGSLDTPHYQAFWPPNGDVTHVMGKEITRFHAVYWPAFLMSAGIPLPNRILAHGWMTVNGDKMGKSLGNFLPPQPIVDAIGKDPLRYYFMREIALGQDGDFSHKNLLARYHGDLGNGLGNLLNRMVASIVQKSFDGVVPAPGEITSLETTVMETARRASDNARAHLDGLAPHKALEAIWELVLASNKYIDQAEPWKLAKSEKPEDKARLGTVAYTVLESLRWLAVMLWPVMPEKSDAIRSQLGLLPLMPTVELDLWPTVWGGLAPGTKTQPGAPLFPRFDEEGERQVMARMGVTLPPAGAKPETKTKKKDAVSETKTEKAAEAPKPEKPADAPNAALPEGLIGIDDLMKVEMKLGLVKAAERVPKSDKLLELKIDIGEPEPRTILAGIGQHYTPEALIGRRLAVVANLPPRPMMGRVSQGMVLAVSDADGLSVLSPDKDITPGVRVK